MDKNIIALRIEEHKKAVAFVEDALVGEIIRAAEICANALQAGGKILFCGNGGSAADSQHLAAEFVGRFQNERRGLPALSLTTDTSILTAVGNDYGFDSVFARQVEALGQEGDVLFAISTSGGSRNVLFAAQKARAKGLKVIGLTGRDGGSIRGLCDICLNIPVQNTARVQEAHILIGHIICELLDDVQDA